MSRSEKWSGISAILAVIANMAMFVGLCTRSVDLIVFCLFAAIMGIAAVMSIYSNVLYYQEKKTYREVVEHAHNYQI
jgi:hypothetical protein